MKIYWNKPLNLVVVLFVLLTSCGPKPQGSSGSATCIQYPSAYEVQYPDGLKKSNVEACDGFYKATPVNGGPSIEASGLVVKLMDRNGTFYLTDFTGQ